MIYIDLNIRLYICGKLTEADGSKLDATDYSALTNNFLHSLFSQCSITLNGVKISSAAEVYHYRAYLETLRTYGSDDAASDLTNAYWYLDNGYMLPCDPTATFTDETNQGFIARWNRINRANRPTFTEDYIMIYVMFRHIYFPGFGCR